MFFSKHYTQGWCLPTFLALNNSSEKRQGQLPGEHKAGCFLRSLGPADPSRVLDGEAGAEVQSCWVIQVGRGEAEKQGDRISPLGFPAAPSIVLGSVTAREVRSLHAKT